MTKTKGDSSSRKSQKAESSRSSRAGQKTANKYYDKAREDLDNRNMNNRDDIDGE